MWQGDDVSKAVHMLAVAEAHSLPSLALRAERYILKNGDNLSAIPEIHKLSSECLVRMLDARRHPYAHKAIACVPAVGRHSCGHLPTAVGRGRGAARISIGMPGHSNER